MYLEQLLCCVDVLLRQCESDTGSVSLQLLQVLVAVQSLSTEPRLSAKVRQPIWEMSSQLLLLLCSSAITSFHNQHATSPRVIL